MRVLVINAGSSSVRYQLLETEQATVLAKGEVQRIQNEAGYVRAVQEAIEACQGHEIEAVGHRVVHGGPDFHAASRLDPDVVAAIEACIPLAPLHNPANLAGIRAARASLPGIPHVAVFDTAFHSRMPRRATTYAIDQSLAGEAKIRRYGFHGTSHNYVACVAACHLGRPMDELRLITCHLGNGASVCAIEYGSSVETSMGMTPLEGLVMGSRCGDLDPGVVLQLLRDGRRTVEEVDHLLNKKSGLAGLSGIGQDLRDIENAAAEGNDAARLAVVVYAHRVKKYIGAYAAVMGGVDAVIVTGGIGEHSAPMRRRILQRLEFLGVLIDENANTDARVSHADPVIDISQSHARTRALVVATNEELEIARQAAAVTSGATTVREPGAIPIAVSAHHAHLCRQTFRRLFGSDAALTKHKDLSQPGQYASEQRVSLIGPRGRIDRVRILGPLRALDQVEVSRTDEFRLGVDAPIRRSGQVAGSAPITLQGPAGTVDLEEGLICAWRHIHMTPHDAERLGVKNGDEVEVAVAGGPRDLTFHDVLVRVSADYALEMHIDTDEANAAELSPHDEGDLVYASPSDSVTAELRSRAEKGCSTSRPFGYKEGQSRELPMWRKH